MEKRDLKEGDVVQIDPDHDPMFGACFMIVTEPKSWGAQGYVTVLPRQNVDGTTEPGGRAYYRCKFENMEYIGPGAWIH
ncbi:MAG: hypothetical protein QG670_1305, partial [Thermoproteota archaeon]|nr:hypothetical protein [Thermoproteota archaeon]